jgi:hypothetical protein
MKYLLIWALLTQTAAAFQLRVTIYDKANLPKELRSETFNNLRRIFHSSKITVDLVAGKAGAEEASVMSYPERVAAGKEMEAICSARRDIALDIVPLAPPGLSPGILGLAQPLARAGLNTRVFYDRIHNAAVMENRPDGTVLAYAIAHEIGHVLLRSNLHASWGLMSGVWTSREYDRMRTGSLLFTTEQSRTIRANLRGVGCPSAGSVVSGGSGP